MKEGLQVIEMVLVINNVDFIAKNYVAYGGLKWQREDVDGPDAGRDIGALMHRERVATKHRLDVTCRPLTSEELSDVLTAIQPESFPVKYYDPQEGKVVTREMYSNNVPVSFLHNYGNGRMLWSGLTFPLIEM